MRYSALLSTTALALLLAPHQSMATVFDIKVSYYGSYESGMENKAAIESNLTHFAKAVYESTNGAHKIGQISIYTEGAFKDNNDVMWVASCHPNAHIGGRGKPGFRIEHCDDMTDNANFLQKPRSGGYVLAHEWGHFTYSLFDEYSNKSTPCGGQDPGDPCATDTPVPNAIMNSTWNAVDENDALVDANWLNFSTAASNNSATNAHYRIYQSSVWETLVRAPAQDPENDSSRGRKYYSDLIQAAPATGDMPSLEITTEEGRQAAVASLSFAWKRGSAETPTAQEPPVAEGEEGNDARSGARSLTTQNVPMIQMFVIDRSHHVSPALLEAVKATVQQAVSQGVIGDTISVVTFDSQAEVLFPPTLIDGKATRDSLIAQVKSIQSNTSPAVVLNGLVSAFQAHQNARLSPEFDTVFYLFAHGAGSDTVSALAPDLRAQGISLYSFISGARSDTTLLKELSLNSGGEFYSINSSRELLTNFSDAQQHASPSIDVLIASGLTSLQGSRDFPFYLDKTLGQIEVMLNYTGTTEAVSWSAFDPAGTEYPLPASHFCEIEQAEVEGYTQETYCYISVGKLPEGLWRLRATAAAPAEIYYEISALPLNNQEVFFSTLESVYGDEMSYGESIILEASVGDALPITALEVKGETTLPDGTTIALIFSDNGVSPDDHAEDGIYTAHIKASQEGEYFFNVTFDNTANTGQFTNKGLQYIPDPQGRTPETTLTPVTAAFQRNAQTEVWVVRSGGDKLDYERVMDWAENAFPQLLNSQERQLLGDFSGYQGVRYYPLTGYGVGYMNGMLYLYQPDTHIIAVGSPADYITQAQAAGF
jgi:hypothetical protein